MSKIKATIIKGKGHHLVNIMEAYPIVLAFFLFGISYLVFGKSVFTYGCSILIGVISFLGIFTRFYANAELVVSIKGISISSYKQDCFIYWTDIEDLNFYYIRDQLVRVVVVDIKKVKGEQKISIFPYFFSNPKKKYKTLVEEIIKYIPEDKFDLSLKKGEVEEIPYN